jgi:hypothetical protein
MMRRKPFHALRLIALACTVTIAIEVVRSGWDWSDLALACVQGLAVGAAVLGAEAFWRAPGKTPSYGYGAPPPEPPVSSTEASGSHTAADPDRAAD